MADWLRPLLLMFYAPARGMAEVRDHVPLGQAALLALLLQVAHTVYAQWRELSGVASHSGAWAALSVILASAGYMLLIALVFVPVAILLANLFERRASFGVVLRQEYAPTTSTAFYALAAASLLALPLVYAANAAGLNEAAVMKSLLAAQQTAQQVLRDPTPNGPTPEQMNQMTSVLTNALLLFLIQPLTLFSLWAVAGVREVFRLSWWKSLAVVLLSTVLMSVLSPVLFLVFSALLGAPFIALLVFFLLRGYFGEMVRGQQARASFRQNLEAATLNPADASAHYNLGLLHMQRKEYEEARSRFLRAVEIDPEETDSHYQLGRIARLQGKLPEAIEHFGQVVGRDEAHAQHEIWREVGATYLAAGQFADAREALQRFLDKRTSDPEGLYLMGRAHAGMGRTREAVEWMQRCVESVRTAPAYKHRADQRWLNEAQQFLRTQP
ncbi:MAG TPA: tetratricopeptide repeat protein [Pyrinomonadaceae bacterium]|jgi:tetratricopeptide (TPR) repeat protein|nr:tetratricopeptide repeat protein [Pyrinomonadaceae bacterium]